ncbi:hypothetical protein DPEC_G00243090 [Dallia pectoralis]|uniref:Uncharacterized protein n=1 Tax=Dallia pectoralis TaxID=75939 RepID=A0ACC2FVG2_DALPE|nr:hypothetical protein DPEC_G00243090 [Dallia pectoralis]
MTLRENQGLLLVGARDAVFALDLEDVTLKKAEVECHNYIQTLQTLDDGRMLVCGSNAYNPTCDYMNYTDGILILENKNEDGRGKVPFDPFQRSTSVMVGTDLYSATAVNFLGTEQVFQRHSSPAIRTEHRQSWFNKPSFIHLDFVPESVNNLEGDDDKVYMFFSEEAVEFDLPSKLRVSRVARVCAGDMGGQRTLQSKWTSYLKVRVDCAATFEPSLPAIVQDVFLLKDPDWRKSVFYAVFTSQTIGSDLSSVCAFSVYDIGRVFSEGRYLTPVTTESGSRWVTHTGDEPVPRAGACINNAVRDMDIETTLDLPDKTLQFVRNQPLMEGTAPPLAGGPLLLQKDAKFLRIVVDRVVAGDGETYQVMFIGTEQGKVLKAVQYAPGDSVIIEETQVFRVTEPIRVLCLFSGSEHLYAGSDFGVVQVPVRDCGRHVTCRDCILARDPYCAWDVITAICAPVSNSTSDPRNIYQSLIQADSSICPRSGPVDPVQLKSVLSTNVYLTCQPASNLARVAWHFAGQPVQTSERHRVLDRGLLIMTVAASDAGLYSCHSSEDVKGRHYARTEAAYALLLVKPPLGLQTSVALLAVLLAAAVLWHVRARFRLMGRVNATGANQNDDSRTVPGRDPVFGSNNNNALITTDVREGHTGRVSIAFLSLILVYAIIWNNVRDQMSQGEQDRIRRMEEGLEKKHG